MRPSSLVLVTSPVATGSRLLLSRSWRQVFFSPRGSGTLFTWTVVPRAISCASSV